MNAAESDGEVRRARGLVTDDVIDDANERANGNAAKLANGESTDSIEATSAQAADRKIVLLRQSRLMTGVMAQNETPGFCPCQQPESWSGYDPYSPDIGGGGLVHGHRWLRGLDRQVPLRRDPIAGPLVQSEEHRTAIRGGIARDLPTHRRLMPSRRVLRAALLAGRIRPLAWRPPRSGWLRCGSAAASLGWWSGISVGSGLRGCQQR